MENDKNTASSANSLNREGKKKEETVYGLKKRLCMNYKLSVATADVFFPPSFLYLCLMKRTCVCVCVCVCF